jgi:hypothetical protein
LACDVLAFQRDRQRFALDRRAAVEPGFRDSALQSGG